MKDINKFKNSILDSDNLYQLGTYSYNNVQNIVLYNYILQKKHEMNIKQVCMDLYNNDTDIITIMDMNSIINPYSLYEGKIIVVTIPEQLEVLKNNKDILTDLKKALIDSKKGKKIDNAKISYNKNISDSTYLKSKQDITKDGNFIKITPSF